MKNVKKYLWLGMLLLTAIILAGIGGTKAYAADSTVKIHIGDSTSARHHMAICLGTTSEEYSYTIKDKYTVESSSYTSSNPEAFSIVDASEGKCRVKANKEGTGLVTLTIKTKEGETLTEKVFVSVYTPITNCYGTAKQKAGVYRGATTNGGVENEDLKGNLQKGEEVKLTATCEGFYIFESLNGTTYEDGKETGFVRQQDIQIPVTGITLDKTQLNLEMGNSETLHATVNPERAENKKITWKSDKEGVATVDQNGVVTAKKTGTANITVTTEDGKKTATCKVTVTYEKQQSMPASTLVTEKLKNTKAKNGKMKITVEGIDNRRIRITWKKKKKVDHYEIYRAGKKNGKFKKIATVNKGKKKFTDNTVKSDKVYYYKVLIVKESRKRIFSKKGHGKTKKVVVVHPEKNLSYIRANYPNVCTNTAQNMNNYAIQGQYTPVKYKFDGRIMEIHVYLDFVQYTKTNTIGSDGLYVYTKAAAPRTEGIEKQSYISLFKAGIKESYDNIDIEGSDNDFAWCNFKTKLVTHVRGEGETFQAGQKFIEVLIGGECPNCRDGMDPKDAKNAKYWYHGNVNWNSKNAYKDNPEDDKKYYVLYMPTNGQTKKNPGEYNQDRNVASYKSTSAHELGHALGLWDAYYDKIHGLDRCIDNEETGYEYKTGKYDNLMKDHIWKKCISANDLEMMLGAYNASDGLPWNAFQSYNKYDVIHDKCGENYDDEHHEISSWIINRNDAQPGA